MTNNALIPEERLLERREAIAKAIAPEASMNYRDDFSRSAFLYHSLFANKGAARDAGFALSPEHAFYNSYFWFLVFSKWEQAHSGYDAGLEQGAFKLLEAAPEEIDWSEIEGVTKLAEQRVSGSQ